MDELFLPYFIDISQFHIHIYFLHSTSLFLFSPQLINIKEAYHNSNRENLTKAFDFAQKHYGIMQLIDPEGKST